MLRKALILMAKKPIPGKSKTRLIPRLSEKTAAQLYECFLEDMLELICALPGIQPMIAFTPQKEKAYFNKLAPSMRLIPQVGNSLRERLAAAMISASKLHFDQVAAVNSDSPTLPASFLFQAFESLDKPEVDIVLGPTSDGGYYLIGWKEPFPDLILNVQMSTNHVFRDTLAIAKNSGLRVEVLPEWYDVDESADLDRLIADLKSSSTVAPHTNHMLNGRIS